jgi:integrase
MSIKILNEKGDWLVQVQRGGVRKSQRGTGGMKKAREAEEALRADMNAKVERQRAARLLGVEVDGDSDVRVARPVPTLREYFTERWIEHAKITQNPTTRLKSEFPFKYLVYHAGERRLDELLEPAAINAFVEAMKKKGPISFAKRGDGEPRKLWCHEISNCTVNKCLQLLRSLLYLAYREKVVATPPKIDLLPEDDAEAIVAISEEEFQQLLKACEDFRDVAPLLPEVTEFTAETGLRRGEVFTLTFRSVDFARSCIRVETQRRVRMVNGRPWKPKNSKWREIPLSSRALAIVEKRRADGPSGADDFVFPSHGGAPYVRMDHAPECAGKGFFPDAVEAAGLKDRMSFHGLRHLFAVRLLTRGVAITIVSELLGHSDINLTVKRYGRFASDAKVKFDAVRVLDQPRAEAPAHPPQPAKLEVIEGGRGIDHGASRPARRSRRTQDAIE